MDPDDEVECPGAVVEEPFPGLEGGDGFGGELGEGLPDDDDD